MPQRVSGVPTWGGFWVGKDASPPLRICPDARRTRREEESWGSESNVIPFLWKESRNADLSPNFSLFTNPQNCKPERRSPQMGRPCAQTSKQWKNEKRGEVRRRRERNLLCECGVRLNSFNAESSSHGATTRIKQFQNCVNVGTRALWPC